MDRFDDAPKAAKVVENEAAENLRECVRHSENPAQVVNGQVLGPWKADSVLQGGKMIEARLTDERNGDVQFRAYINGQDYADNFQGGRESVYRVGKNGATEPATPAEYFQVHNFLGKIDFDGLPECKIVKPAPINIGKESQKIADMYDFGKKPESEDYTQRIDKATGKLSADLEQLSGKMSDFNKLLKGVADNIPDEPAMNPRIDFTDKKGDRVDDPVKAANASVVAGDNIEAYRIVLPGNTFEQIARDSYKKICEAAGSKDEFMSYKEYRKSLIEINKIQNVDKVLVGQAIRTRAGDFTWS
jgi:hypothetical protein